MEDAISIANYLIAHARAAFRLMALEAAVVDAEYQLRHIRQRNVRTFTKRDLFQWTKGRFERVGDLDPGLKTLAEHNYVRELDDPEKRRAGRPRSRAYEVNPELYSQNPQKLDAATSCEDFEDATPHDQTASLASRAAPKVSSRATTNLTANAEVRTLQRSTE